MMPLELREVTSPKEIPDIITCLFQSFGDPDTSIYYLICPLTGVSDVANNDRVLDFSMREWFDHSGDPTSHWIKVVDTDSSDKVVASMRWNFHKADPFGDTVPQPAASWVREGPTRRFTEAVLHNLCKLRFRKQPHAFIYVAHTHPEYRKRGAGRMMMDWGVQKADELGLDCFVEASPLGHQLYSKYGFRSYRVAEIAPSPALDEDSDEWRSCRDLLGPLNCIAMKRPARGEWPEMAEYRPPQGNLATNIWEKGDQL